MATADDVLSRLIQGQTSPDDILDHLLTKKGVTITPKPPDANLQSKLLPSTPGIPTPELSKAPSKPISTPAPGSIANAANSFRNLYTQGIGGSQTDTIGGDTFDRITRELPPTSGGRDDSILGTPGRLLNKGLEGASNAVSAIGEAAGHPWDTVKNIFQSDPFGTMAAAGGALVAVERAAKAVSELPETVANLKRANIRVAANRVLRPIPSNPDFPVDVPEAFEAIKAVNPGYEPAIESGGQNAGKINLVSAGKKTANALQAQLEPWHQRVEGQTFKPTVIQATKQAVSELPESQQLNAKKLIDDADTDWGGEYSSRQGKTKLENLNKRLRSYYNSSPESQAALDAQVPTAILEAQRSAAANDLYNFMDPENNGAGPREIQRRTGNVLDVTEAANRRSNSILAEQPLTRMGEILDPLRRGVQAILPKSLTPGFIGATEGAGLPFAEGSQGKSLPTLKKAFAATNEQKGINDFGSLPKPGPRHIAAPADTSGPAPKAVADFKSVGSPYQPQQKLLPPAPSAIDRSGTLIPGDTTVRHAYGRPDQSLQELPPKLLSSATPVTNNPRSWGNPPPQSNPYLYHGVLGQDPTQLSAQPGRQMPAPGLPPSRTYDPFGQKALDYVEANQLPKNLSVTNEPPRVNAQGQAIGVGGRLGPANPAAKAAAPTLQQSPHDMYSRMFEDIDRKKAELKAKEDWLKLHKPWLGTTMPRP